MEFSKKIYLYNLVLVAIVVVASFVLVALSGVLGITDFSPITVICTSAFVELGTFSVAYSTKAKAENTLRIAQQIKKEKINTENIKTANAIMNGMTVDDILNEYPQRGG